MGGMIRILCLSILCVIFSQGARSRTYVSRPAKQAVEKQAATTQERSVDAASGRDAGVVRSGIAPPHDPLSLQPASCPAPSSFGPFELAEFSLNLTRDGRLEESIACYEVAVAMPGLQVEARQAMRSNIASLRVSASPWRPGIARLFHNFEGEGANFPHSDTPLGAPRSMAEDPAIQVWDGALTRTQCQKIIDLFEAADLFEGNVISEGVPKVDPRAKKAWEFDVSGVDANTTNAQEWYAVERLMTGITLKYLLKYEAANPVIRGLKNPLSEEGFRMRRYHRSDEHHTYHVDSGQEGRSPTRVLAAIIYFNEAEEGGETVFLNQGRAVAPACGRVLFFPSAFAYVHAGKRVKKGTKYIVTSMITL
jgi:hypothetical protein